MMDNIGIITKAYLWWNAWCDSRTDQFESVCHTMPDGKEDEYVISNFVNLELRRYENKRTRYQHFRPSFFGTPAAWYLLWIYKLRGLNGAVADMDSALEKTQGDILAVYLQYSNKKAYFQSEIERYNRENASHYAAMMRKKGYKAEKRYVARERRRYVAAINILKRKINLLEKAQGLMAVFRDRFFLRIATYYRYASRWNTGLPVQYMGNDRFAAIANISTISPYEEALRDAREKLAIYSEQLSQLFAPM